MIKERRRNLGIRLAALGAELGVSESALSRYENGKRQWPPGLYERVLARLGMSRGLEREWFWSWPEHLRRSNWNSWEVEVDPGQTWADLPGGYEDFYRALRPRRTPSLEFRRLVRADSELEPCAYSGLCEAGANPALISLPMMGFPHHPLVQENGKPLGLGRRAAFVFENWIFWPQVNLLINRRKVRLDCLGFDGTNWADMEFDGPLHQTPERKAWDAKRDAQVGFAVIRFSAADILGGNFLQLLRRELTKLSPRRATALLPRAV